MIIQQLLLLFRGLITYEAIGACPNLLLHLEFLLVVEKISSSKNFTKNLGFPIKLKFIDKAKREKMRQRRKERQKEKKKKRGKRVAVMARNKRKEKELKTFVTPVMSVGVWQHP